MLKKPIPSQGMVGEGEAQGSRGAIGGHNSWERSLQEFGPAKQFTKGCGPNEELDYKLRIGSVPIVQLR